jgi:arylsulfatase A-like enzyme
LQRRARDKPFFEYVAYTAPHWPLHAHDDDIARYRGRFDAGWDRLRQERLDKLVASGILKSHWKLTERDPTQPPWTKPRRTSSSAPGRCAAWRSTRRRSTAWTRASGACSRRSRSTASSPTRW